MINNNLWSAGNLPRSGYSIVYRYCTHLVKWPDTNSFGQFAHLLLIHCIEVV